MANTVQRQSERKATGVVSSINKTRRNAETVFTERPARCSDVFTDSVPHRVVSLTTGPAARQPVSSVLLLLKLIHWQQRNPEASRSRPRP
jgi:hypothetical protein